MADDASPARIRWQDADESAPPCCLTGYAGAVGEDLFRIFPPDDEEPEHVLTADLPGMRGRRSYGTPDEVKAEAERWLTEFASSLGAVFPPAALEWAVRVDTERDGDGHEYPRRDEDDARAKARQYRENHPHWQTDVASRVPAIPAGPWEVVDGG
jgi:hypothetical protein